MKRTALLLALILAFACPALAQTGATATPDHVHLTWTGSPATTITINWRTDASIKAGMVEYVRGSALTNTARRAAATSKLFVTDLGTTRLYAATLTGLTPDTQYSYRVGNGSSHWSTTYTFTTAKAQTDKVKFLVFGDSQSPPGGENPYGVWKTTLHNAYKANPDAKFFVNCGDLVDLGQDYAHWKAWFGAAAGVIDTIPAMPVVGNHETTPAAPTRRPTYWIAQFTLPQNGPDGLKTQVYSFDYGPVHIAVLDSQQAEQKELGDIFGPQKAWLEADLAASKAPWKLVFFHKAPYEAHPTRSGKEVRAAFCPTIEAGRVDVVFSGHDHGVTRTYPMNNEKPKQKPSEGTIYCMAGRSGTKAYSNIVKMPWNSYFYNPLDQPNYQVVEIDGKRLTVQIFGQDGTPISSFYIDKARDVYSDCLPQAIVD